MCSYVARVHEGELLQWWKPSEVEWYYIIIILPVFKKTAYATCASPFFTWKWTSWKQVRTFSCCFSFQGSMDNNGWVCGPCDPGKWWRGTERFDFTNKGMLFAPVIVDARIRCLTKCRPTCLFLEWNPTNFIFFVPFNAYPCVTTVAAIMSGVVPVIARKHSTCAWQVQVCISANGKAEYERQSWLWIGLPVSQCQTLNASTDLWRKCISLWRHGFHFYSTFLLLMMKILLIHLYSRSTKS